MFKVGDLVVGKSNTYAVTNLGCIVEVVSITGRYFTGRVVKDSLSQHHSWVGEKFHQLPVVDFTPQALAKQRNLPEWW